MITHARELALALAGTAVGWILGYGLARARAWQLRRRERREQRRRRYARFHSLRVAPGSRIDEGTLVALNERGEAVVVTVGEHGEIEGAVLVVEDDDETGKPPP